MSDKRQPTLTQKKELTGVIVEFQASEPIQCKQQTESRLPIKNDQKNTTSLVNMHAFKAFWKKKKEANVALTVYTCRCALQHTSPRREMANSAVLNKLVQTQYTQHLFLCAFTKKKKKEKA